MTSYQIFHDTVASVAEKLGGTVKPSDGSPDIRVIQFSCNWAGFDIVARLGAGADHSRIRFSGSLQSLKGDADYRELPKAHELETAQAISRGPKTIAAQVGSKILTPGLPMLATWREKLAAKTSEARALADAVERYKIQFPKARVEASGDFYLARPDGGYLQGDISSGGGLYIRRISRVSEKDAFALISSLMEI